MDHHYQTMNPPPPNPLIMHYINLPPLSTPNSPEETPPLTPTPRKKGATENTNPPVWKPIVDSSVCDNFNLILILVL